jgi:hypothetical protein
MGVSELLARLLRPDLHPVLRALDGMRVTPADLGLASPPPDEGAVGHEVGHTPTGSQTEQRPAANPTAPGGAGRGAAHKPPAPHEPH